MNNRAKMRASNKRATEYLNKMGYTDIMLRTHCKHKDYCYNNNRIYRSTDFWNLFDGMMFDRKGELIFIQIKTNAWASEKPIKDFIAFRKIQVMTINVRFINRKWVVQTRDIK